jgi:hypothetical protein
MTYLLHIRRDKIKEKQKKYAGKYTRNKYLYRVFAASFILLISGNKPISIPL